MTGYAERIVKAFSAGISPHRVARKLRLPVTRVHQILRANGVTDCFSPRARVVEFHARIDPQVEEMRRLRRRGSSLRGIGATFGISASSVQHIVGKGTGRRKRRPNGCSKPKRPAKARRYRVKRAPAALIVRRPAKVPLHWASARKRRRKRRKC